MRQVRVTIRNSWILLRLRPRINYVPSFGLEGIALASRNNTSDVIEVLWDQSSYIDESDTGSRLIRGNVRLVEKDHSQPDTVIPPGTKINETVFGSSLFDVGRTARTSTASTGGHARMVCEGDRGNGGLWKARKT